MKKKNYLNKAEQGVLIGTSFLLLNGVMSCSDTPMDTPPVNTLMTKGPVGPPSGPPGSSGITYYPAGTTPILNTEFVKSGFIMTNGDFKIQTTIPWRYNSIIIKMNENTSGYAKKVTNVEVYGHPWANWFTRGNDLIINQIKAVLGSGSQIQMDQFPTETVYITVDVSETTPIVLSFQYTI